MASEKETHDCNLFCPMSRLPCMGERCACSVHREIYDDYSKTYEFELRCGLVNNSYVSNSFCSCTTFDKQLDWMQDA